MFALAARSASAFAGRRVLARASPRLLATAAAAPQVPVGEILLSEPGVVVVRDTAGVGGAEVEPGTRLALANGREGTVVLTRSPLCVVCLDDDADLDEDAAALALRRMAARSGESGGDADAFVAGVLKTGVDARKLAGRVVDGAGAAADELGAVAQRDTAMPVFDEGLQQAEMEPIDEFATMGVPAVDLMVPLGKGQSVVVVGDLESRDACRDVAVAAVGASLDNGMRCVYAALDGGRDGAAGVRAAVPDEAAAVVAKQRASAFANECEAVLCCHAALALGDQLRRDGDDALVVLDGLEPLVDLWRRSTRVLSEAFGAANVDLGDDSECRAFFSSALQRVGRKQGGGSLTIVALMGDEGARVPDDEAPDDGRAYALDDFVAAGARASIMDRLKALDARGVKLTEDVLGKIGVAAPDVTRRRRADAKGQKRRSEACDMLTSIGDAHVEVVAAGDGGFDVDASASLQRVGVGADVGTDTRPAALRRLGVGNRLRLELASATNVEADPEDALADASSNAADERALVRAAAWTAALRHPRDAGPRALSAVVAIAIAVQAGHFDGVDVEDAAPKVAAVLAAADAVDTAVDASQDLSDADLGALKVAITLALQDA